MLLSLPKSAVIVCATVACAAAATVGAAPAAAPNKPAAVNGSAPATKVFTPKRLPWGRPRHFRELHHEGRSGRGSADSYTDRFNSDRCIIQSILAVRALPGGYGNFHQIVQRNILSAGRSDDRKGIKSSDDVDTQGDLNDFE